MPIAGPFLLEHRDDKEPISASCAIFHSLRNYEHGLQPHCPPASLGTRASVFPPNLVLDHKRTPPVSQEM